MSPSNDDTSGPKVKCAQCSNVIQSMHVHHFVSCECGAIFIDGGSEYVRLGFNKRTDVLTEAGELWFADESVPMDPEIQKHLMDEKFDRLEEPE